MTLYYTSMPPKATPFEIAKKVCYLKGKPIDLSQRPYLEAIYNSPAERMLLKFGRQSEKSTTLSCKISIYAAFQNYFNTLFVSSSQSQSKEFSNERVGQLFRESPFISENLHDTGCVDRVDQKNLLNGSNVYFRYAFHNADRTRGISADFLCLDEIQDIQTQNIPVIEECVSHSDRMTYGHPYKTYCYAGTPKTSNNAIEFYWQRSTQREWGIKCEGCNTWALELGLENIGKEFLICKKCGKQLHPMTGQWIKCNPDAPWDGFHLCQLQVPWLDWKKEIIYKMENYPQNRFFNEVLGLSYDSGSKPITAGQLRMCCNEERKDWYAHDDVYIPRPCVAGVDWGLTGVKSYTIFTVGCWLPYPDKFVILYQKRYEGKESDVNYQTEDIKELCHLWNVDMLGCDWGAGLQQNLKLMEHFGTDMVMQFYNSGNQRKRVTWNADRMMFVINRTLVMTDLFNLIDKKRIEFPCWDLFKPFGNDFRNVDIEYSRDGVMYYDHNPDNPDDTVHSTMYAMLAGEMMMTGRLT